MSKQLISLRITPDSYHKISKWADETGITRTEQIQRMLDWAIKMKEAQVKIKFVRKDGDG